jgi:hypothetical protein
MIEKMENVTEENHVPEEVLERLRASKQESDEEDAEEGQEAGTRWVDDSADVRDLKALERFQRQMGHDWDVFFMEGDSRAAYGVAERFVFEIQPSNEKDRAAVVDFWNEALGEDDAHKADNPSFVKGFAEGALERWDEVKEKL